MTGMHRCCSAVVPMLAPMLARVCRVEAAEALDIDYNVSSDPRAGRGALQQADAECSNKLLASFTRLNYTDFKPGSSGAGSRE